MYSSNVFTIGNYLILFHAFIINWKFEVELGLNSLISMPSHIYITFINLMY